MIKSFRSLLERLSVLSFNFVPNRILVLIGEAKLPKRLSRLSERFDDAPKVWVITKKACEPEFETSERSMKMTFSIHKAIKLSCGVRFAQY